MSSVVLKIKDSFNKALNKGLKCDVLYLNKQDYADFCSDLQMESASEIDISGIKLSIVKTEGKDKSYLHIDITNISKTKNSKKDKDKEVIDKYYI